MTRYTNVGRKRTYIQAGFDDEPAAGSQDVILTSADNGDAEQPTKKKTHRAGKKIQKKRQNAVNDGTESNDVVAKEVAKKDGSSRKSKKLQKLKGKHKAAKTPLLKEKASEARRVKRIQEKAYGTTCFICREQGHAARYCPKSTSNEDNVDNAAGRSLVGMCYRCGSQNHPLSRCRKPVDRDNPMPFATCFVCSGKGHLTSSCPQNAEKGVYPNGGACKLCGQKTHLAKDCGLRQPEVSTGPVLGTGREAGADEDDFHTIKRKGLEVDKEEKAEVPVNKLAKLKPTMDSKAKPSAQKKVVFF